jgi:mono/diheme cytochrome c family protein
MKTQILGLIAALLVSTSLAGTSAHAADPANGKRLAERWCASCHVVSADQARANVDAPAFATMGRKADFDAGRMALFLLAPHPPMPNMSLTRNEAIDIASYIRSVGRSSGAGGAIKRKSQN